MAKNSLKPLAGDHFMPNDLVVGLISGIALMFLATGVTPMLTGRRGQIFSFVMFFCFVGLAWKWPNLQNHVAAPLNTFIVRLASNGYVWTGMIAVTWLYVAVDSLFAPYRGVRPARTKPSLLDQLVDDFSPKLPESLARDREYLVRELTSRRGKKAQIFFGPSDRCNHLANELSEILNTAGWVQVNVPMLIPQEDKVRRGFSIRSSSTDPGYDAGLILIVTLRAIGISPWTWQSPDLRQFDYCFVYIAE
jgi:hypothetical protein